MLCPFGKVSIPTPCCGTPSDYNRRGAIPSPNDTMSILTKIVSWIYKNVRISIDDICNMVEASDTDDDGYLSVGEIIAVAKGLRK